MQCETNDLIERLKKATGPDRNIDARISYACKPALQRLGSLAEWLATDAARRVPSYTYSIDDALMLVPAGFKWSIACGRLVQYVARLTPYAGDGGCFDGECDSTAAIALCIAVMLERQASGEQGG